MHIRHDDMSRFDKNSFLLALLCGIWIAGLTLGFFAARLYGDTLDACMLLAPSIPVLLSGFFPVIVFPLLISACAVILFRCALYPICFLRSFFFALTLGSTAAVYGDAGLLMAGLLMFSSVLFSPVLLWYWWRRLEMGPDSIGSDTLACLLIGLGIGAVDSWVVSPFLAEIVIF